MKINRNNYEPYFIDYLEGNLDESLVDDFIEFLSSNPDLKEELTLFEPVSVEPDEVVFNKKELLFKDKFDLESEFSHAAVANLEGDLSLAEKSEFENYILSHPEKSDELTLFAKTKLAADVSIVYNKKNRLYKKPVARIILMWGSRVAAVLVLAISVYLFIQKNENKNVINQPLANVEEKQPETVTLKSYETAIQQKRTEVADVKTVRKAKPVTQNITSESIAEKPGEIKPTQNSGEEQNVQRIVEEIPASLNSIMASIEPRQPDLRLETMYLTIPEDSYEEHLLVEKVIEKTGIEKFSLNKIAKAGLNLFTSISNKKFTYQTDNKGKVTEVNFDSRLLAFSIPTTLRSNKDSGE